MADNIILLTGEVEALHFTKLLNEIKPDLNIIHAGSKLELEDICAELPEEDLATTRLIAFCINVIVPKEILQRLPGPSYNFHPGPPAFPGSHAANFAFHEGLQRFGVTFHEMTELVDEGKIIAVKEFGIASCDNIPEIEARAFSNLAELFTELAPLIADVRTPIPAQTSQDWSGPKRGEADWKKLIGEA